MRKNSYTKVNVIFYKEDLQQTTMSLIYSFIPLEFQSEL